jgi:aryl-alcohol dehydrogenase-like predicted oxidoreductase
MAENLGLAVTAWSPLASGLLSGKYHITEAGVQSEGDPGRMDNPDLQQFIGDRVRASRVIEVLKQVAGETRWTPAQIALAWLRQRRNPIIPIVGARKLDQLRANLEIVNIELSDQQIQRLDEVSKIELGFPHDLFDKPMVRSFSSGRLRDQILA